MIDYVNYKIMKKNIFKHFFSIKKINFSKKIDYEIFNDIDLYILM